MEISFPSFFVFEGRPRRGAAHVLYLKSLFLGLRASVVVGNDSDLFAEARGRRRRNEVKRSFLRRDLVWQKTTCWPGFERDGLKVGIGLGIWRGLAVPARSQAEALGLDSDGWGIEGMEAGLGVGPEEMR